MIQSFKNIPDVISQELLKEMYNLNHKCNIVILPTKECHARLTGLPTHGSHPNYSARIYSEVEEVLAACKDLNDHVEKEDHPKPDPQAVKQDLLDISEDWYEKFMKVVPENKKMKKYSDVIKRRPY